ncbi:MAG: hypothetical protein KDC34_11565 [Saprospiraceae bacterium]|nr:hypothetical protein [Saprospiraceae bacterium]
MGELSYLENAGGVFLVDEEARTNRKIMDGRKPLMSMTQVEDMQLIAEVNH